MVTLNADGMVILAGVYQAFPLKAVWFLIVSALGGMVAYAFTKKKQKTLKDYLLKAFAGAVVGLVLMGASRDLFEKDLGYWAYFFAGVASDPFLMSLVKNMSVIVDAIMRKVFDKFGLDIVEERKGDDTESSN